MSLVISSGQSQNITNILRDVVVEGGNLTVKKGGILIDTKIDVGSVVVDRGGIVSHTVVVGGQIGHEVGATLDIDGGRSISATIKQGGSLVQQGGRSIDMVVECNNATIFNGAVAVGTRVTSGGELEVGLQSVASNTVVTHGGSLTLTKATATATRISAGGSETLFQSRASGTLVTSGGFELIGYESVSVGAVIDAEGSQTLGSLGSSIGTIVNSGGTETVSSGGTALSATVRSGGTVILKGGTFSGHIAGGAQEIVEGYFRIRFTRVTYDSLSVAKNAELSVRKGGIVEQTVIHSGGTLVISSGGAGDNTILAGGHEIVSDGGHITGTQIFRKGASLTVQSLKPQTLVISGFGTTNAIDFTTLSYGPGESLSASYDAGKKQTTLTIADTTGDAKIVLFGQYAAAGFELKSDGGTGSLLTYSMPISASHQDLTVPHR